MSDKPTITIEREHNGRDYDVPVFVEFIGSEIYAEVAEDVPELRTRINIGRGRGMEDCFQEDIRTGELAFYDGQEIELTEKEELAALDAISRFNSEHAAQENGLFIGGILKP